MVKRVIFFRPRLFLFLYTWLKPLKVKQKTSLLILVAGPYRSGTDDDPIRIRQNVDVMTEAALKVYNLGHLPVLGEWFALPLIEKAGSHRIGDKIFTEMFHPVALRLIEHCDAVLRIGGPSEGADEMVSKGAEKHKIIFHNISEIPPAAQGK